VLAAGEKRRAHFLLGGYLITEAVDACDLMSYVIRRPDAPAGMPVIVREAARVAAALHDRGFYHGDLKLVNLYRTADDAPCGVWDLDSAQLFPGEVPHDLIVRELGRIVSSVLIFAEQNPAFPDGFFNLNRVAQDLTDAYSATGGAAPSVSEVKAAAYTRWLRKRRLRFDYGGQAS
jgi:serine/threonine protein kinase